MKKPGDVKKDWTYPCKVIKVKDGDTVDVVIYLGDNIRIKKAIRFHNINAPETRTRDKEEKARGMESKKFVKGILDEYKKLHGKWLRVKTYKPDPSGKYADRWIGELVLIHEDGPDIHLNQLILDAGYAVKKIYK